jgi:hypothetical protein
MTYACAGDLFESQAKLTRFIHLYTFPFRMMVRKVKAPGDMHFFEPEFYNRIKDAAKTNFMVSGLDLKFQPTHNI